MDEKAKVQLRNEVLGVLERWRPTTVRELRELIHEKRAMEISYEDLNSILIELKREKKLEIQTPKMLPANTFITSLTQQMDFWLIALSMMLLFLVIYIPQLAFLYPLRFLLGILMTFVFPGYAIQMAVFPQRSDLQMWKRILLATGLSFAAIGFYAIILDLTPQGITLATFFPTLSIHTIAFLGVCLLRRYMENTSRITMQSS